MWVWAAAVVLGLALWSPACQASLLGAVVSLEPVETGRNREVRIHTSILAPKPCPSLRDIVCEGTNCVSHVTSDPTTGQYPTPGWCLRQWQWQSNVPLKRESRQTLGATDVILSPWADFSVRPDNNKVNQPPLAALMPPLRVNVNCPKKFHLSVIDLDGDRVRCRYGNAKQRECQNCSRHDFLQLDQANCVVAYNGLGETGQYLVELMVEDFLSNEVSGVSKALSSIPLQLSLTVEGPSTDCQASPTFTEKAPARGTKYTILPYEELDIKVEAQSSSEKISEIAIVGPPALYMAALKKEGSLASINLAWLRNPNSLPQLLSVCFTANTQSMQSEIRCVWIRQKIVDTLPPGTVLQCGDETMKFSFPISSIPDLQLSDLQLNDPSCPILYNTTHVMGLISLKGCGTKAVHSGSELVYTNTLRTMLPDSPILRLPTLVLRLSCRFPGAVVGGPHYNIGTMEEEEVFGPPEFSLFLQRPGDGPISGVTQNPQEEISDMIDLYIFSNTTLDRAELQVSTCLQSPTSDFKETYPFLQSGCASNNVKPQPQENNDKVKVFRLDLSQLLTEQNVMYVRCRVLLCVALRPSDKCPSLCKAYRTRNLQPTVYTREYVLESGPVFVGKTATTTVTPTTTTTTTTAPNVLLIISRAPAKDSFLVMGMALGVVRMLLQTVLL